MNNKIHRHPALNNKIIQEQKKVIYHTITITLTEDEMLELAEIAKDECRTTELQATWFIKHALKGVK